MSTQFSTQQQLCLNTMPDRGSTAQKWMSWHKSLVKCLGKMGANSVWSTAWDKYGRGNPSAYNTALGKYMKDQGVNISESFGDKALVSGANVGSFFGGYFNFVKITGIVLGGGVAIAFLILLYTIIINPDKAKKIVGTVGEGVMLATPQGMAAKAVGSGMPKSLPQ